MDKMLFTSESVTCGHPDKVCDQIADAVLDAVLAEMKEDGTIADILAGYGVDAKAALVG